MVKQDKETLIASLSLILPEMEEHIIEAAQLASRHKELRGALADAEMSALSSAGAAIEGKNAEERELKKRVYLASNVPYTICEHEFMEAEHKLTMSMARVEVDKMYLRIYEMLVKLVAS